MRRFIEDGADDHPLVDDEKAPAAWSVAITDDCEVCADPRVVLTVEPEGEHGNGVVAHLGPAAARRLRVALATALKEIGETPD